jgi:hypothetical protein
MKTATRSRAGAVLLTVVATTCGLPATAAAQADTGTFEFHETETFPDAPNECMPGYLEGVTNASNDGRGHFTVTDSTYMFHWDDAFTYRTDFADGSYLTGVGYGHHTFTGNETVDVGTETISEPRTIYASDGTPVAKVRLHFVAHLTIDAGTGEARADIERFFFTCS